jgi:long-chain acyl-CoA synthetase
VAAAFPEGWQEAADVGMTLAFWAARQPDVLAIAAPTGDRTFAALNQNANRLARLLGSRGLHEHDRVLLLCGNRAEFAETVQATVRTGLRVTTLNWHLTAEEASYIADDCGATAIVAAADLGEVAAAVAERTPRLTIRLAVGGPIPGFEDYASAIGAEDGTDLSDPLLGGAMLYTSGTTGRPKGVHRRRVDPASKALNAIYGYRPGEDRHLCTGPLYHAAPLAFSLAAPLQCGVGVTLMPVWDVRDCLHLLARDHISHTHMVPTMFHRLLAVPAEERARTDTSALRFVIHGAAPCPVGVKQELMTWLGPIVHEYYAATEGTGTWITPEQWLEHPGSVGRAIMPDGVMVGDAFGGRLPAGETGQVYLRAAKVDPFEYFGDEEKTRSTYRGEWFTLGDVGHIDEDGWVFLTDRSANLIITGGVNVYPAEVDAVLLGHPAVGDVAVIGIPSEEWGEEVKAVVELRSGIDGSDALAAELIAFCRGQLAHFKCPRTVDFVDTLPRLDNGKIYKRRLRDLYR